MAREGTTLAHRVALRPGLNSLVATIGRDVAPPEPNDRIMLVAEALGDALQAPVDYAGPDSASSQLVFVIGQGRPIYIGEFGEGSPKVDAWYASKGSPSGPAAHYFAVHIDWRGQPWEGDVPAGLVAFPGGTSPKVISYNWPDGDADTQAQRLADEKTTASVAEVAQALDRAEENLASFLRRYGFPIALVAVGVFAAVLAMKLGKR